MKNLFLPIVIVFSSLHMYAQQSVGIGTTSPQPSSILDITSTTKGLLIPRMTFTEKNNINSPVQGLLVFQTNAVGTNQSGLYYYSGMEWKRFARYEEIGGGGNNSWTILGDNQYSNLAGNVGIGTTSPTSKLHVVGNILQDGASFSLNHTNGIFQFKNANVNKAYVQLSGNNLRLGTNSGNGLGNVIFRLDAIDRVIIDSLGRMGIGTMTPSSDLHVYQGRIKVEYPGVNIFTGLPNRPYVNFEISNEHNKQGGLYFARDGNEIANFMYHNRNPGFDLFRFGISDPDALDLVVTENSRVGINLNSTSSTLEGQLHIRGGNGVDEIALVKYTSSQSPTIQFHSTDANGLPDAKEAFIQLSNGDDLRMGTNGGNATGKIVMRMNGDDKAAMNPQGWFGIGTTVPYARLHLENGQDADPNPLVGNGYLCIGDITSTNIAIDHNEILARNYTGPATLTIQNDGGLVRIGNGNSAAGARLHVSDGSGANLTQHGHVVIGETNSTNITIDNNEVQARNNGGAGTLYLQRSGGLLDISGHTTISKSGSGEVLRLDGTNPNIGFYQSGSYKSFISQSGSELFLGVNGGKMHLDATQIAIGSVNTSQDMDQYKLTVSGKVICEELKVELYNNWPDYVFAKDYALKPLNELKSFIETNHHLPNIPKASEVAESGIELGDMNRRLLEKVEELTLYIIDLQEQIDEMKVEAMAKAEAKAKAKAKEYEQ